MPILRYGKVDALKVLTFQLISVESASVSPSNIEQFTQASKHGARRRIDRSFHSELSIRAYERTGGPDCWGVQVEIKTFLLVSAS